MGRNSNGRGGRGGRGGRSGKSGRGNNQGRGKSHKKGTKKMKFAPMGGAPTATYEDVKNTIYHLIQSTFDDGIDMVESLKQGSPINLDNEKPRLQVSTATDAGDKEREDKEFGMIYSAELKAWMTRKKNLKNNLSKSYSTIFSKYCTAGMQHRVKEDPDFDSRIDNNPFELMEITKTLTHESVRNKYPCDMHYDALLRFLTLKQKDDSLVDYIKKFKEERNILVQNIGTKMFDDYVERTEDYKNIAATNTLSIATQQQTMKADYFEAWTSYVMLKNSDQTKYGPLIKI